MGRSIEHAHQVAYFTWVGLKANANPLYLNIFAVPNGARTSISVAKRLKAEGMRKGIPDIFVAVGKGGFYGLFIEMKIKPNYPKKEQRDWKKRLELAGYCHFFCYSVDDAMLVTENYIENVK